jgi:DNA-binding GntR family transcriptional regulator
MIGVSRTSMREALRHLAAEGLIQTTPHKGNVVATVTVEDVQQIYQVRGVIEPLAARLFTERATVQEISALETAERSYEQAIQARDVEAVLRALTGFYDIILGGCGNDLAVGIIRSLHARMQYLRAATTRHHSNVDTRRSIGNFRRIVRAIRNRDPEAAAAACSTQVEHAAAVALRMLRSGLISRTE